MGFGLLFLGYLFMYSFPYHGFDVLPDLVGFAIAFFGVKNLADYGCGWDIFKKFFYIIIPAGTVTVVFQTLGLFNITTPLSELWGYVYTALMLVYNILMLTAIYKIADDTEVKSIKIKAQRNLFLGIIYYALMLFFDTPFSFIQNLKTFLSANYALGFILYIYGYLWQFLNTALIFSCYMWICKQGDEEMPEKEPKFFKKKNSEEE